MNAPTRLTNAELADWSRRIDAAEAGFHANPGQRRGYVRPCPQLHRIMANEQPRIAEDGPFPWRAWAIASLIGLALLAVFAAFALWVVA